MSDAKHAGPRIVMPQHLRPVQKAEIAAAPAVDLENPALQSFIRGEHPSAAPVLPPATQVAPIDETPVTAPATTGSVPVPQGTPRDTTPPAARHPWDDKSTTHIKQYQLRLPERLHAMLEFLGETSYRESMHSIALVAIRVEVERRLKARGIAAEP
ncbi:MAG: hypothetical protein EXR83_14830 [Gammaproteobacteria bacterium]|nr:hypothetical protein [Gammaproteobacteria bacterium]